MSPLRVLLIAIIVGACATVTDRDDRDSAAADGWAPSIDATGGADAGLDAEVVAPDSARDDAGLDAEVVAPDSARDASTADVGRDTGAPDAAVFDAGCAWAVMTSDAGVASRARPIAPMSGATTTSLRPTLRWSLGDGATGATVQICSDRACAMIESSIAASGDRLRPAASLSPGVHFWRLFASDGAATDGAPSATWWFRVGRADAANDTSWGLTSDFDGDGYADVAVTARDTAFVHLGGAGGLSALPVVELSAGWSTTASAAGDLNGDGFTDLLVSGTTITGGVASGATQVYLGGRGVFGVPDAVIGCVDCGPTGGVLATGIGDVDGDGYGDAALSAPAALDYTGIVHVHRGGPHGLSTSPTVLTGMGTSTVLGAWVSSGDVDGDGLSDLVVAGADTSPRPFFVFRGSPSGPSTTPIAIQPPLGVDIFDFGRGLAVVGDLNADGFADVAAAGCIDHVDCRGEVYVYHGSASGLPPQPSVVLTQAAAGAFDGSNFGIALSGIDVDRDGYDDLLVGAPTNTLGLVGTVFIYRGGASGLANAPSAALSVPMASNFGSALARAADYDGDTIDDVAIGAPFAWGTVERLGDGLVFEYLGPLRLDGSATPSAILSAQMPPCGRPYTYSTLFGHSLN